MVFMNDTTVPETGNPLRKRKGNSNRSKRSLFLCCNRWWVEMRIIRRDTELIVELEAFGTFRRRGSPGRCGRDTRAR